MGFLRRLLAGSRPDPDPPRGDPVRIAEVEAALMELAPLLAADGGRARLVAVDEEGGVDLALEGACASCALVPLTLKGAIEPRLKERCGWITAVRANRGTRTG